MVVLGTPLPVSARTCDSRSYRTPLLRTTSPQTPPGHVEVSPVTCVSPQGGGALGTVGTRRAARSRSVFKSQRCARVGGALIFPHIG